MFSNCFHTVYLLWTVNILVTLTNAETLLVTSTSRAINILGGLKGNAHGDNRFFRSSTDNIVIAGAEKVENNAKNYFGPFVQLTFHPDITDLLQEFYGTIQFDDGFKAGGMFLEQGTSNSLAVSNVAIELGIKPEHVTQDGNAFVLARYWKTIKKHSTGDLVNISYVKQFENINRSEPDNIISMFSQYGTHYVPYFEEGDFIYQVYVYDKSTFDTIKGEYPDDQHYRFGHSGSYYRQYTEPRHKLLDGRTIGYSKFVGTILAASRDPFLSSILPSLHDSAYDIKSLLVILTDYSIAVQTNNMKSTIPSKIKFKSIADKMFENAGNLKKDWNELLKGAMFQRYGSQCSPSFKQITKSTPLGFYDSFNPDLVTNIATSYTSIIQVKFNLARLVVVNPDFVQDLFIFADVIELSQNASIHLPGSRSIVIMCREFRSNSVGSSVPKIVVGSVGSNVNVKLIASSFKGAMKLVVVSKNHVQSFTYVGESVLKTVKNGTETEVVSEPTMELKIPTPSLVPKLFSTISGEFRNTWFARSFLNGMELLVITIENVYSLRVGDTIKTAKKSLEWIIEILKSARSEVTLTSQLELVLTRALLIEKQYPKPGKPLLLVPTLTFPQYKQLYVSLLTNVKLYEVKLTSISSKMSLRKLTKVILNNHLELNKNVLEIGKFLVGEAKSESKYYDDVTTMYQQLSSKKDTELSHELEKMKKIKAEVNQYSEVVRQAGNLLAQKVKAYQAKATYDIVAEMVSSVGGMFTGGFANPELPTQLGNVAMLGKKIIVVKFLTDIIAKLYSSLNNIQNKLAQANADMLILPDMSRYDSQFPTVLDWEDFQGDINLYTDPGTLGCCGYFAAAFKAAVKKLTTRGIAFMALLRRVSQLQYEILVNKLNFDVAKKQKDRLQELSNSFRVHTLNQDFKADNVDLLEVGNILQSRANIVRMQLARTYLTMDAALQYYYLKPATPLTGYDTISIQSAAMQQLADSISAFELFPSQPHDLNKPVVYEIPMVRISELTSKSGYTHTIPLTAPEFQDYVRIRIREIRVTVSSVQSADADGIYIISEYIGDKCRDRDLNRNERIFSTASKEYPYVYNYKNGSTIFGNVISTDLRDKVEMMTPFCDWTFTIPKVNSTNLNVNIRYSSELTTLRIEFYLNVILKPATTSGSVKLAASDCKGTGLSCLKQKISGYTTTGKFDAIMALNAQKINDLWAHKYTYQTNHGGFAYDLTTGWVKVFEYPPSVYEAKITGKLGPPLVSFMSNNPKTIKLTMKLNEAVYQQRQTTTTTNVTTLQQPVNYTKPITITSINTIGKIQGYISSHKMVVVDMTSSLVRIDPGTITGAAKHSIETNLKEFFKQINSSSYDLGTVDYNSALTPPSLQPRHFLFTTAGPTTSTNAYGTLYLCILTGGSVRKLAGDPLVCEMTVLSVNSDPVIPTGYTAALYVSSKIIFEIIQNAATSSLGIGASVVDVVGKDYSPAKRVIGAGGSKVGLSVGYTIAPTCEGGKYETVSINVPANTIQLTPTGSGQLQFLWSAQWDSTVYYYKDEGYNFCRAYRQSTSAHFDFSTTGLSNPSINSDGVISFPQFTFSGTGISSSASWKFLANNYGRKAAANAVANKLKSRILGLRFNVSPISIFALTNLIFPEAKVVEPKEVYLFGDLLILGDVVKDYNPRPQGLSG